MIHEKEVSRCLLFFRWAHLSSTIPPPQNPFLLFQKNLTLLRPSPPIPLLSPNKNRPKHCMCSLFWQPWNWSIFFFKQKSHHQAISFLSPNFLQLQPFSLESRPSSPENHDRRKNLCCPPMQLPTTKQSLKPHQSPPQKPLLSSWRCCRNHHHPKLIRTHSFSLFLQTKDTTMKLS